MLYFSSVLMALLMRDLSVFQKPWKQADNGGRLSGGFENVMHKGRKMNLNKHLKTY